MTEKRHSYVIVTPGRRGLDFPVYVCCTESHIVPYAEKFPDTIYILDDPEPQPVVKADGEMGLVVVFEYYRDLLTLSTAKWDFEETIAKRAENYPSIIYFFAELDTRRI